MTGRTFDAFIDDTEALMRRVVDEAEAGARTVFRDPDLPLYDVIRYHLGWVDEQFAAVTADPGKRVRPVVCLLSAGAAGGNPGDAVPAAAAIELLHNFTLMHDDIQDRSELRRGRPTVWRHWGEPQAINAGDATFALSQLALLKVASCKVDARTVNELVREFNRMTLQIVEGQVLDLGFEQRWDIGVEDYLRMIGGKTAAIVAFAAWAGARIAGRDEVVCGRYHEFGRLLGIGFQVRDDYLGIWGEASTTGKQPGDDIRGRKQSIPIIMLLGLLSERQAGELRDLYRQEELTSRDVEMVTELLDRYNVDQRVQQLTTSYHDQALEVLNEFAAQSTERDMLADLAERLVDRSR